MLKKDENINCLQTDFEESTKKLTIMKGILPKVSGDRDMLWERVKQCSEENMLLSADVNILKKKIEALEEDLLLKEGQITILKDSLGNKLFDPFAGFPKVVWLPKPVDFLTLEVHACIWRLITKCSSKKVFQTSTVNLVTC